MELETMRRFADHVSAWVRFFAGGLIEPQSTLDEGWESNAYKEVKSAIEDFGFEKGLEKVMPYFKDLSRLEMEWPGLEQNYYRHIGELIDQAHELLQDINGFVEERQKRQQEAAKADALAVVPNEPQQVAQGQQMGNNEPQHGAHKARGRGRPKGTLQDKMIDDADGKKLLKIHKIWGDSRGKDAVLIIVVCIKIGWMKKPTYTQVRDEFGEIGSKTIFNRYLDSRKYTDDEIEGIMNRLGQD